MELGARGDIEVVRAAARGGSPESRDPSDGSLRSVPFEVTGDRRAWSVEGRYSGVIVEDEEGLRVRLDRAVIWVRAEHGDPVTVGEVRAALGRREGSSWTFHASSERRPIGRRLAPGDSLFLDEGVEFSHVGAESAWLSDLSLVFEHSLLRPGEMEPYGWTWAAGPVADTGSPDRGERGRRRGGRASDKKARSSRKRVGEVGGSRTGGMDLPRTIELRYISCIDTSYERHHV